MLQFHIAVCDDEPFAASSIQSCAERELQRLGAQAEIEVFGDAVSLGRRLTEMEFDIILLDIELPGIDGIKFARALREKGSKTEIVFVSNSEDRVFESLPVRPLSFVRKSHFTDDMAEAMNVFVRAWKSARTDRVITLKMDKAMGTFSIDEILYFEARGHNKIMHLTSGWTEKVFVTFEELEEKLVPMGFCRVHKGFLVNFAHVDKLESKGITMGEEFIPISRQKRNEVKLAYLDYLSKKHAVVM